MNSIFTIRMLDDNSDNIAPKTMFVNSLSMLKFCIDWGAKHCDIIQVWCNETLEVREFRASDWGNRINPSDFLETLEDYV